MAFILFIFLFISKAMAGEIQGQIFDLDYGEKNEEVLIYLSTGNVATYPGATKEMFEYLHFAKERKLWFIIVLNHKREIQSLTEIPSPYLNQPFLDVQNENYIPTILNSIHEAQDLFLSSRKNHREESQCYNRAHVWTYEWRIKKNFYSSKAWLFFSRKFIRKYKFSWWFHVAPMVYVSIDDKLQERVMDMKYAQGPLKMKDWTDIFMRESPKCIYVKKYSDHANFPESSLCYIMKSSMYYYQPFDLELAEVKGIHKGSWIPSEVIQSYKDAFDIDFTGASE